MDDWTTKPLTSSQSVLPSSFQPLCFAPASRSGDDIVKVRPPRLCSFSWSCDFLCGFFGGLGLWAGDYGAAAVDDAGDDVPMERPQGRLRRGRHTPGGWGIVMP